MWVFLFDVIVCCTAIIAIVRVLPDLLTAIADVIWQLKH
jgi:hypothetical protein